MRKKYYHAAIPETMEKIIADGVVKRGWDGCVYLCEKPQDAAKFVAIRGHDEVAVIEVILPANKVKESFDHSAQFFQCKAFMYEKEKRMFILSQDKTRIFNTSGHIEGIGYKEENFKEGKKEEIRHTIQVFGGCAEEIAEYKCKEDCLLVLYAIFNAIEQGGKTAELPTQEEMKEQREALKQYLESGKKLTEWTAELLKELLDM